MEIMNWHHGCRSSKFNTYTGLGGERRQYKMFMEGMPPNTKTVISTDGCLTIPRTPKTAKKPG